MIPPQEGGAPQGQETREGTRQSRQQRPDPEPSLSPTTATLPKPGLAQAAQKPSPWAGSLERDVPPSQHSQIRPGDLDL